jgi:hypothetical protein
MRGHTRVVVLCCAALCVPLLVPLCTGRVFVWDDLGAFHLPVRHLYREALRAGDSVLWTPALFNGTYLFGEGQAGMAHPFHWLLYRGLPLGMAFNIELASSYVIALAGMWLLLRRCVSSEGALFGAMVFAFSGFNLQHLGQMNAVAVAAHVPWILLAIHSLLTSPTRQGRAVAFAGVAFLFASEMLLGYPQYVWLTLLTAGCFVLWLLRRKMQTSALLLLAWAGVLSACIAGVQLLPTLDVLRHSSRAITTAQFRMTYSLPPISLVQLWSPYSFAAVGHDYGIYNSAFCTAALAWIVARWPALKRRDLAIALLAFAALAFILALGQSGGIYRWLSELPGLASFRAPSRFVLLMHFAFAGIAAIALDDLIEVSRRRERVSISRHWPLSVPLVLNAATLCIGNLIGVLPWASAHGVAFASFSRAAVGSAFLVATTMLMLTAQRGVTWTVPALVLLAAFDLGLWGYRYAWRIDPPRTIEELASRVSLPAAAGPSDYMLPVHNQAATNLPVLRGFRLSAGYLGLNPRTTLNPDDPMAQRIAGVRWRFGDAGWVRVQDSMPRARLVSNVRTSDRIADDVRLVDLARVALIDTNAEPFSGESEPGAAHVVTDRPGRIEIDTKAPGTQLLVLTERFHEGWQARDETGRLHQTVPIYGEYLGCLVPAGTHRIALTFMPASARTGMWLTISGLAMTTISAWLVRGLF